MRGRVFPKNGFLRHTSVFCAINAQPIAFSTPFFALFFSQKT
jgi:hypothetical protein